jgi:Protein of unknown function (DUF3800)
VSGLIVLFGADLFSFNFSDKHKYMLMLTAYLDETGHSKDEKQRFNGMAGLIAPAYNWEVFERKWKATLKEYKLPFFHMKDFANFKGHYEGWSEERRKKLFGKLMLHMETIAPLPIGIIIPMEEFRKLTEEEQGYFEDPYYFCWQSMIAMANTYLEFKRAPLEEKVAMVFSDQVEFKKETRKLWEIIQHGQILNRRAATSPDFRDMRELVPLQAADIVAYEAYKEYERLRHRPNADQRFGLKRLTKMSERHGHKLMFTFHTKATLDDYVEYNKRVIRQIEYENKKMTKS